MSIVGVFDSGIGGLTVAREVSAAFPEVDLYYLGDTARLPYGVKSPATVVRYALRCVEFLVGTGADVIVVACNTATACALPDLQAAWPHKMIVGVIEPGARAAVAASRSAVIGVIGTEATISSASYTRAIHALNPSATVHGLACPLLVPLAEVGWLDHDVTRLTIRTYLKPLFASAPDIDTLVLGCTHYPALKPAIAAVLADMKLGHRVALVDSAEAVTADLRERLAGVTGGGLRELHVTDLPARFASVAATFWRGPLPPVSHVDITAA
ncbi:MAG: glutamate racemase [Myxococcota bacterium]|jgi:glutamate racemase